MKRIYYAGIIILLLILAGAFILSPYSPLNKINVAGETIKLSSGYSLGESSENSSTVSNGTNDITISGTKHIEKLNQSIDDYISKVNETYSVNKTKFPMKNKNVIKTVAKSRNSSTKITKYWFVTNNKTFNMQTENGVAGTEKVIKEMISSMD